jgi:hypothetical protein
MVVYLVLAIAANEKNSGGMGADTEACVQISSVRTFVASESTALISRPVQTCQPVIRLELQLHNPRQTTVAGNAPPKLGSSSSAA